MTVKELMSFLEKYDSDTVVTIVDDDCNPVNDHYDIKDAYAIMGSSQDARNFVYLTF